MLVFFYLDIFSYSSLMSRIITSFFLRSVFMQMSSSIRMVFSGKTTLTDFFPLFLSRKDFCDQADFIFLSISSLAGGISFSRSKSVIMQFLIVDELSLLINHIGGLLFPVFLFSNK